MMMTIKKLLLSILLICTSLISFSQDDFGIWYSVAAEKKLIKNLDFNLDFNIRTYKNASEIGEMFFNVGLSYKLNKYLSAAASYRYTEFREKDDLLHPRHKWFADLKGKLPLGDFEISARLRFQQGFRTYFQNENDKKSKEVGRIKLNILYDIPSFPVNPYLSAEFFFPMFSGIERNIEKKRYFAGFEYNIAKKHSIKLEYIFQRDFVPHTFDMNIISVGYYLKF